MVANRFPALSFHDVTTDPLRASIQQTLGDSYTLERELGGGGMSRVFIARDESLGRQVVVKVLAPELAQGLSAERFTREIRLAAGLQEPHIVPVHAAGMTTDGLPYYTMPFVEGESLRARLQRGTLAEGEAVSILRDVAKALAYAHGRGIVHRDIKPENVLLSSGTAVVTDFGIAKALQLSKTRAPDGPGGLTDGALTQLGTSLGTPAYMAPEQAAGDPNTDHRADIYAWGILAYELIAGKHPFASKTSPQQLMAAHFGETPAVLTTPAGGVSRAVSSLVMRCLAKDPADRPAAASELVAVLDGVASPSRARALSSRARIGAIAAALVVVIGAGLTWRALLGGPANAEARGPVMLAVLPFESSGSAEQAVFADGLTDALTAKLGALTELGVIDRRSAAQYRDTKKPAKQIGEELGVHYLVEGVVRWAKDANGAWRAQVTPTLVDTRAGTTKWSGDPVVITPDDPFTAQTTIATKVAEELRLALQPADRANLARRLTDNPEAFAAYQRGGAIFDSPARGRLSPYEIRRAIAEMERAVALDSTFAEAWSSLAGMHLQLAIFSPGDRAVDAAMRAALDRARAHAPEHPMLLQSIAYKMIFFDRDTVGVDRLVGRALASAPNDAKVLSMASLFLFYRQQRYDSAYVLARKSVELDPRSAERISLAAFVAAGVRRWDDVRRYADALTALDSTSEQPWFVRLEMEMYRGDTLAMQRELSRAFARFPETVSLLKFMPYAGDHFPRRFITLSARDLRITTLADSITNYYDARADAFTALGDLRRARTQYDSIRTLLTGRTLSGYYESQLLSMLALAQASLDQPAEARKTLARSLSIARMSSAQPRLSDVLSPVTTAAIYARLGEPDSAVRWLELALASPGGGLTARGLAVRPKLTVLRGTPAFERLLRKYSP